MTRSEIRESADRASRKAMHRPWTEQKRIFEEATKDLHGQSLDEFDFWYWGALTDGP